jgi:DNA-directed RNA polymerase subunit omega
MIRQSTDDLERYIGNKYALVIVSAKRARQLKEGHPPLSRDPSPNPLSIAMREIQEERLQPVAPPEEEIAPAPRDVIASLVASTDFDLDDDMDFSEDTDAVGDLAALLLGADEEEEEAEAEVEDPLAVTATADDAEEDTEETAADEEEEDEEVAVETDDEVDAEDEDE